MSTDKTLPPIPPLPPIKHFQLDYILKHEVPKESQQVVDSLLNVSSNYRKDLKKEIRLKLSIEQKLQNKNIEISKLARLLDKQLSHDSNSITKQLNSRNDINDLDNEVLPVVELTNRVSVKFKNIAKKLQGKNLDPLKYPNLCSYYNKVSNGGSSVRQVETAKKEQAPKVLGELDPKQMISEPAPKKTKDDQTATTAMIDQDRNLIETLKQSQMHGSTKVPKSSVVTKKLSEEPEIDDPENFEQFMSDTLYNYRKQQQRRYSNVDVFVENTLDKTENQNLYDGPHFDNSLASTYHKSQNPLDLLATLSATKSPASVSQDLQISHFKKLRINGNPITSETFGKDCECNPNGSEHDNSHTTEPFTSDSPSESLGSPSYSTSSDVDPIIVSSSSEESESESDDDDNDDLAATTNQYYTLLHEDYRDRKKKQKRRNKGQGYVRKESPTPKHEPLHHKLKPKGSILKITNSTPRVVSRNWPVHIAESKKANKIPGPSLLGSQTINSIDDSIAQGIIVREETDDNEIVEWYGVSDDKQIKSLNKLKTFVD